MSTIRARINHQIRAPEVRVIGPEGEILGVMNLSDALRKAAEFGLDLIEVAPEAMPPVAKITDYGKFQYEESKKRSAARGRSHTSEVKIIQIKIGTGEHDLSLKARKISEWLTEGHRTKVELFLSGRAKYLDPKFLEERLNRVMKYISVPYRITEPPKRGPKGLAMLIEK